MQIAVEKLVGGEGGEIRRKFSPKPDELAYADVTFAAKPIRVEVLLQNAGGSILGHIQVGCSLRVECSRCLESYVLGVSAERQVRYLESPTDKELETELDGWFVSAFDGETVVLDEDVRQILMLALPLKPLCREDCRGLCPKCGVNRNTNRCACATAATPDRESPFRAAFDRMKQKKRKS